MLMYTYIHLYVCTHTLSLALFLTHTHMCIHTRTHAPAFSHTNILAPAMRCLAATFLAAGLSAAAVGAGEDAATWAGAAAAISRGVETVGRN